MYPKCLELCLAHGRHKYICWMNNLYSILLLKPELFELKQEIDFMYKLLICLLTKAHPLIQRQVNTDVLKRKDCFQKRKTFFLIFF